MNLELIKAVIYSAGIAIAALIWAIASAHSADKERYALILHQENSRVFMLDKRTGAVWRYYTKSNEKGQIEYEGLSKINNR